MERKYGKSAGFLIAALVFGTFFITGAIPGAAEEITLQLWSGYPEMEPYYELAIKDYQKEHPDVRIQISTYALRDFERKINISVPTGTGPDFFEGHVYLTQPLIEAGCIVANSPQVDSFLKSGEFFELMVKDNTYQERTYGLPVFQSTDVMFWNKKMFIEAALPGPPATWQDMMSYAKKLAKYDAKGNLIRSGISLRLSGAGSGVAAKWWYFLRVAGGDLFVETSSGKYHNGYDNIAGRDTLKLYIDLVHKDNVDNFKIKHDAEAFALEKTAMFIREPWVVGYLKGHAPQVNYDIGFFPKYRRWETLLYWNNLYVTKKCEHPKEVGDFIMSLSRPGYDRFLFRKVGWLPPRKGLYEKYRALFEEIPQYKNCVVFPEGYEVYSYPKLVCTDEALTKLAERLVKAFTRSDLVDNPKGIAKVIEEAAEETDNILKEAGLYGVE